MQCIVTNSTLAFDFIFFLLGQATDYVLSFVGGSSVAERFHGTSELTRTRRHRYVCCQYKHTISYIQRCMDIFKNNRPIGRSPKQKFRFRTRYIWGRIRPRLLYPCLIILNPFRVSPTYNLIVQGGELSLFFLLTPKLQFLRNSWSYHWRSRNLRQWPQNHTSILWSSYHTLIWPPIV